MYCPLAYEDLQVFKMKSFLGKEEYYIGTKRNDRTMRINGDISSDIKIIITLLDGNHSLEEIRKECEVNGICVDVNQLIDIFKINGFFQNELAESNNEIRIIGTPIMKISFRNLENKFIDKGSSILVKLFPISILLLLIIIVSLYIYNDFEIPINFNLKKTAIINALLSFIYVFFHEVGHIIYAKAKKIELDCFEIRLRYGIYPTYFIKYSNLYFISPTIRIRLFLAGVGTHVFFCLVGIIMMIITPFFIGESILECNIIFIYYNLVPIYLTDGYYSLSTVFNVYNYRICSLKALLNVKYFFSLDKRHRIVAVGYGVLMLSNIVMGLFLVKTFAGSLAYYSNMREDVILGVLISLYIIQLLYMIIRVKKRREFNFRDKRKKQ